MLLLKPRTNHDDSQVDGSYKHIIVSPSGEAEDGEDMAPYFIDGFSHLPCTSLLLLSLEHESFACRAGLADLEGLPPLSCHFSRMGSVTSILSIWRGDPRSPLRPMKTQDRNVPQRSHLSSPWAGVVCPSQANNLT